MGKDTPTILATILLALEELFTAPPQGDGTTGAIYFSRQVLGSIEYIEMWIQVADGRKKILTFYDDASVFGGNELRQRIVSMLRARANKDLQAWLPSDLPLEQMTPSGKTIVELNQNEILAIALMTATHNIAVLKEGKDT